MRFAEIMDEMFMVMGQMLDRSAEGNERLRVIERDIETMQRYVGVLASKPSSPKSCEECGSPWWNTRDGELIHRAGCKLVVAA